VCCRYKAWYKRGGLLGRTSATNVQYNTVNPVGLNAKRPLYYHGTRSDLENETLRIEVWDWDPASSNDLIGFAEVPLRGILVSGRISTGLAMRTGAVDPADPATGRLVEAGSLTGNLEMVSEPTHTQFGDVVKRLPKMTYLAVHVQSCIDLVGKKTDGMSDPYVRAEWSAVSQNTRVIRSTCAPQYDETLYFPTNLVRITTAGLEAKGDIVLYVLHHTKAAPSDLGFCRIPLDRITSAAVKRIEDSGSNVKTRVYEARLPLQLPGIKHAKGMPTGGEVRVRLYFTPDVPSDVVLKETEHNAADLPQAYQDREFEWRAAMPYRIAATGRFLCSALDETNTRRFLPTYLSKCAPPRELTDPKHVAKMVHCITFQQDAHLVTKNGKPIAGSGGEELWSSPNYFLDVKKGASEDHAILQCNLFLGLGLDAYLAIGRLPGGSTQHVWVMTREPNGDVLFWETTKGDYYTLPMRWTGLYLDGAAEATNRVGSSDVDEGPAASSAAGRMLKRMQKHGEQKDSGDVEDKRKQRAAAALAQDKAEREAYKKAQELAEAQKKEEALLFQADEEQWSATSVPNPFETPRDFDHGAVGLAHAEGLGGFDDDGVVIELDHDLATHKHHRQVVEHVHHDIDHVVQEMRVVKQLTGAVAAAHPSALDKKVPGANAYDSKPSNAKRAGSMTKQLPLLDLPPMREQLPYETLEVLINHENVWANVQGVTITQCGFNLEDNERWHPFIDPGVWVPPSLPRPFYSVGRIGPQLPPQRLSALRMQLFRAIKSAYTEWRTTRSLRTRWATSLEPTLDEGLRTLEKAACSSQVTEARAVDKWRGQLLGVLPADYRFVGRAFSFSVTTPELVVDHLMEKYDYHTHGHKEVVFALSVQCYAHYGAVASTWVYVGYLTPHAKSKKGKGNED